LRPGRSQQIIEDHLPSSAKLQMNAVHNVGQESPRQKPSGTAAGWERLGKHEEYLGKCKNGKAQVAQIIWRTRMNHNEPVKMGKINTLITEIYCAHSQANFVRIDLNEDIGTGGLF